MYLIRHTAPALEKNQIVIMDRFYDSTTDYRGYERGISPDTIAHVNHIATGGLVPARTFYIDIGWTNHNGEREGNQGTGWKVKTGLFEKARQAYLGLVHSEPDRLRMIDGTLSKNAIEEQI